MEILGDCLAKIYKLILKFIWKCKGPRIYKTTLKKLEDTHFPISNLMTKLQKSRQCSIGIKMDLKINRIELKVQIKPLALMVSSFLTRVPRLFHGKENCVFKKLCRKSISIFLGPNTKSTSSKRKKINSSSSKLKAFGL